MLYAVWQIFAFAIVLGALGLVFWDGALRGQRDARAKTVGVIATMLALGGGAAWAFDHWWGWLLLLAALAVGALAPEKPPIQG